MCENDSIKIKDNEFVKVMNRDSIWLPLELMLRADVMPQGLLKWQLNVKPWSNHNENCFIHFIGRDYANRK